MQENDVEILKTNQNSLFWDEVENVIKQNRKSSLEGFLFKTENRNFNFEQKEVIKKIQVIQSQVNNLEN